MSDPKIDVTTTKEEFEIYKLTVFDLNFKKSSTIKLKIYQLKKRPQTTLRTKSESHKIKLLESEIETLKTQIDNMTLSEVFNLLSIPARSFLFPNILILLEMAIICPISNATAERLFSFLKLVKTKLRNRLGDGTLDKLLRIKIESKEELEDHDLKELVECGSVQIFLVRPEQIRSYKSKYLNCIVDIVVLKWLYPKSYF